MSIFFTSQMKKLIIGLLVLLLSLPAWAGNNYRSGSAGATQLLILPWARTGALAGSNLASVSGMEAMSFNVAGLAYTKGIDIGIGNILYMGTSSGILVNSLGIGIRMGESSSTLGLSVTQVGYGDLDITTVDMPEGGLGVFAPNYLNIGLSYAKEFSNSIYGGLTLKMVSQSISNVSATSIAFDAGINYVTGPKDNVKFGISLRNVGGQMTFKGDGLDVQGTISPSSNVVTLQSRSQGFELPAQMGLGLSYDVYLATNSILDLNFTFLANSFTNDQFNFGVGYEYKEIVRLAVGYLFEDGITSSTDRSTMYTGFSGGLSVNVPLGKGGSVLGLDYAYRFTNPFGGNNQFTVRLNF
jgi:hypothetical protein